MNPSLIVFDFIEQRVVVVETPDERGLALTAVLEAQQAAQAPTPTDRSKPPA